MEPMKKVENKTYVNNSNQKLNKLINTQKSYQFIIPNFYASLLRKD